MKINIKTLTLASFTKERIDEKKVLKISKLLKRTDLKIYIKFLKLLEKKNTVNVWVSSYGDKSLQNKLSNIFKSKRIVIKEDKELLSGIKIEDFDNVYEFNLKNSIKNAVDFMTE